MIAWTCSNCQRNIRLPSIAIPPVHCVCGFVSHEPIDGAAEPPRVEQEVEAVAAERSETEAQRLDYLRERWKLIHTYPIEVVEWTPETASEYFRSWLDTIPKFGCNCNEHFRSMMEKYPPDFSSRENFFKWIFDRHNDVNSRLIKPILNIEQAWSLYSTAPLPSQFALGAEDNSPA